MHSILFSLDHIVIHSFGACLAIAILLCYWVMVHLGKQTGYTSDFISNLLTLLIASGLVGARLAYVIEHWSYYSTDPKSIIMVQQGGLMFYGGLLLACAALILFCIKSRKRVADVLDLVVTMVPLGHCIGRIGCFLNGCCYGRASDSCLAVRFPHGSIPWSEQLDAGLITSSATTSLPVLPSQLFESALNLLIFFVLLRHYPKRRHAGSQVALYMILYATVRFIVEFSRADERLHFGWVSISQAISIVLFVVGIGMFIRFARKPADIVAPPA